MCCINVWLHYRYTLELHAVEEHTYHVQTRDMHATSSSFPRVLTGQYHRLFSVMKLAAYSDEEFERES